MTTCLPRFCRDKEAPRSLKRFLENWTPMRFRDNLTLSRSSQKPKTSTGVRWREDHQVIGTICPSSSLHSLTLQTSSLVRWTVIRTTSRTYRTGASRWALDRWVWSIWTRVLLTNKGDPPPLLRNKIAKPSPWNKVYCSIQALHLVMQALTSRSKERAQNSGIGKHLRVTYVKSDIPYLRCLRGLITFWNRNMNII